MDERCGGFYGLVTIGAQRGTGKTLLAVGSSIEATKKMIEQGLGVSLLPVSAVQREVEAGLLVKVPILETERITLPTAIMFRRTRKPAGAVEAFLRLVEEIYGKQIIQSAESTAAAPSTDG